MDENEFKIEVDKYFDQFDDFIVTCIRIMNHTHVLHGLPCGKMNRHKLLRKQRCFNFVRLKILQSQCVPVSARQPRQSSEWCAKK